MKEVRDAPRTPETNVPSPQLKGYIGLRTFLDADTELDKVDGKVRLGT